MWKEVPWKISGKSLVVKYLGKILHVVAHMKNSIVNIHDQLGLPKCSKRIFNFFLRRIQKSLVVDLWY